MTKSAVDAYAMEDGDLDLRSLGAALWRRKLWIIVPTLVVAIGAAIVVNLMTPSYKSEARIVYDGRENAFLRPDAEKSLTQDRGPADPETLTDQVQIVLSRELALGVIADLKLNELPEFDPVLRGPSILRHILAMAGLSRDLLAMSPEERVLESWYERLTAYSLDKSRVIVIEFQSANPALAARVTNAVAADYLRRQQLFRQEQTRGAGDWLANQIEGLRRKVADAEAKAEAFRGDTNLMIGTNNTSLSNQQLGEFNSQFVGARAQKADAETRARIVREMLRQGVPIEASDILNSELIRRLSEQRVTLRGQLAEQSSTLLDGHPRIKELRAQIADLDHQIRAEAEKLARSFDNDARIAAARVDAMTTNLDSIKKQAASANEQDVQYRALEREAKAERDLLESYLAKYRESTARETIGNAPPDAKVISAAIVSNTAAFPRKVPIIVVATLLAFVLSSGLVTTSELMRAVAAPQRAYAAAPKEAAIAAEPEAGRSAEPFVEAHDEAHNEARDETHDEEYVEAHEEARAEPPAEPVVEAPAEFPAEPVVEAAAPDPGVAVQEVAAPAVPHPALGMPLGAIREVAARLRANVPRHRSRRGAVCHPAGARHHAAGVDARAVAYLRREGRHGRTRQAGAGAGGYFGHSQFARPFRRRPRRRHVRADHRQGQAVAGPPHSLRASRSADGRPHRRAAVRRHDAGAVARLWPCRHRRRCAFGRLLPARSGCTPCGAGRA